MPKDKTLVIDQYKIAVASTEKVSTQRADANKFYLSVNSIIAGGLLFYNDQVSDVNSSTVLVATVFGVIVCVVWVLALIDYRKLNKAKFDLITKMEADLPIKFFTEEWSLLNKGKWHKKYKNISRIERLMPLSFAVVYIAILIIAVKNY